MAIDKGGLRYIISVQDQFTAPLKKFRGEVAALRREMSALQTAQARAVRAPDTDGMERFRREQRQLAREQLENSKQVRREQEKVERSRQQASRREAQEEARAQRERLQRLSAEVKQQKQLEKIRATANRDAKAFADQEAQRVSRTQRLFQGLRRQVTLTDSSVNRISFTFRRLIGIFAAFQAVRVGAQAFVGLIRGGVQFNQSVEDAEIGLSALLTASTTLRDQFTGELVPASQQFGINIEEARRQTRALQRDAIGTVATFEELLFAFRGGLAPGIEAGLEIDQIRDLTIRFSQAAAAMTLPQNQLVEEIRSSLRGTISPRNTIIPTVLGITAEQVKQAREAGQTYEFFRDRLQAFGFAAQATQQSFTGLTARIRDSVQFASGNAAVALFDQLKISMEEIIQTFVELERNAEGKVEGILPNPRVLAVLRTLFAGIADSIVILREGFQQMASTNIQSIVAAVALSFQALSAALVGLTRGTAASFGGVFSAINAVLRQLGLGGDKESMLILIQAIFEGIGQWVAPILVAAAASAALKVTWFVMGPMVSTIAAGWAAVRVAVLATGAASLFVLKNMRTGAVLAAVWGTAIKGASAAMALFGLRTAGVAGLMGRLPALVQRIPGALVRAIEVVGLLALAFEQAFQAALGFDITFGETLEIMFISIKSFLKNAQASFSFTFKTVANGIASVFNNVWEIVKSGFAQAMRPVVSLLRAATAVAFFLGADTEGIDQELDAASEALKNARAQTDDFILFSPTSLANDLLAINKAKDEATKAIEEIAKAAGERDANNNVRFSDPQSILDQARAALSGVGETFTDLTGIDLDELAADFAAGIVSPEEFEKQINEAVDKFEREARAGQEEEPEEAEAPENRRLAFLEGVVENFDLALSLMRSMTEQFSAFVADSIVDAFDPNSDTTILERFAQFLQTLARMIIQELTKVAVAKLLLGIVGDGLNYPSAGGSVVDGALSFARGGSRGFAEGGQIPGGLAAPRSARPKGLDSRDTTPIWAQPGEFMVKKAVASNPQVGQFLDALNRGLIQPGALKSLLASKSRRHISGLGSRGPRGYAEGGKIQSTAATATALAPPKGSGGGGPQPAFLVANNQTMEKMLAGGGQAFRRYLNDNAAEIDSILRRGRTGG